jgi:hypothetical protein
MRSPGRRHVPPDRRNPCFRLLRVITTQHLTHGTPCLNRP